MNFKHSRENAKALIAINLVAWTAGGIFLYRNLNPAEEPLRPLVIEVPDPPPPRSTPTSTTATCSEYHCEFVLASDSKFPRSERMFLLAQMGAVFSVARDRLAYLESSGKPPLLEYGDPAIAALLRSIIRLNETVGRKYGYEPIPVSGPDEREQFRSVNRWLGRGEDLPIDDGSLGRLDLKIVEAVME